MSTLMTGVNPGQLGGPALLIPAAAIAAPAPNGQGLPVTLVKFHADNRDQGGQIVDDSPMMMTATIAASEPAVGSAAGPLVGVIRWGTGNSSQFEAWVDVPIANATEGGASGVQVTVLGDYLEIAVRNDANVTPRAGDGPIGNPNGQPVASAGLAIGTRASTAAAKLTRYGANGVVAPAGLVFITIPKFAVGFRMFRADAAQAIEISQQFGFLTLDGPYVVAAGVPAPFLPIVGNASVIQVKNTGAGNLTVVGAVFDLSL